MKWSVLTPLETSLCASQAVVLRYLKQIYKLIPLTVFKRLDSFTGEFYNTTNVPTNYSFDFSRRWNSGKQGKIKAQMVGGYGKKFPLSGHQWMLFFVLSLISLRNFRKAHIFTENDLMTRRKVRKIDKPKVDVWWLMPICIHLLGQKSNLFEKCKIHKLRVEIVTVTRLHAAMQFALLYWLC